MTASVTLAGYVAIVSMMVGCEIVARRTGRVLPLARAVDALARWRPVWALVLAGWLWVGWHLFVRVHR